MLRSVAVGVVVLLAFAAAPAQAHTPGSQPVDKAGSFVLDTVGTENSSVHEFLISYGLPIGGNDTLQIHFIINGGRGPPIDFEIHTHTSATGYLRFFNSSGSNVTAVWKIPYNDSYMVWFVNPNSVPVNVTYTFVLFAPPGDLTPLIIFPLAVGAALGWFLWLRAGQEAAPKRDEDDWRDNEGENAAADAEAKPAEGPGAP